jgi:TPR repeat protein
MYELGIGLPKDHKAAFQWYKIAAEQGSAEGQSRLGYMYEFGNGVSKNEKTAARWYTSAAKQEDPEGQWRLGTMYQFGDGVPKDSKVAFQWYKSAAEQGSAQGQWRLGSMYEFGTGVSKNKKTAVKWYTSAAKQDSAAAQWRLGTMYQFGIGVPKDNKVAFQWYKSAAEQGNTQGLWRLGSMYELGTGVSKNVETAVKWYINAAKQDSAEAQWRLGTMYEFGIGITKDEKIAVQWYSRAAEQGNAEGLSQLGAMYYFGIGVTKNEKKAVNLYKRSAKKGNFIAKDSLKLVTAIRKYFHLEGTAKEKAFEEINTLLVHWDSIKGEIRWLTLLANEGNTSYQLRLGYTYEMGRHIPVDKIASNYWYKMAENGDSHEQFMFGLIYGLQDNARLTKWYTVAANQGHPGAQFQLGLMSESGENATKNYKQAIEWYSLAAKQGHKKAADRLNVFKDKFYNWDHINKNALAVSIDLEKSITNFVTAQINYSTNGEKNLYFVFKNNGLACDATKDVKKPSTKIWYFNNQAVQMLEWCRKFTDSESLYLEYTPKSYKGANFVVSAFRKATNNLAIKTDMFSIKMSGKGFTKTWNSLSPKAL